MFKPIEELENDDSPASQYLLFIIYNAKDNSIEDYTINTIYSPFVGDYTHFMPIDMPYVHT
jgi:hypothetical protein